jgi:hypothetical protein
MAAWMLEATVASFGCSRTCRMKTFRQQTTTNHFATDESQPLNQASPQWRQLKGNLLKNMGHGLLLDTLGSLRESDVDRDMRNGVDVTDEGQLSFNKIAGKAQYLKE